MICTVPDCNGIVPRKMEGNNATCSPSCTRIKNRNTRLMKNLKDNSTSITNLEVRAR